MKTCINHPDRETRFVCMKYGIYMCEVHDDPETPIRVFVCGIIDKKVKKPKTSTSATVKPA